MNNAMMYHTYPTSLSCSAQSIASHCCLYTEDSHSEGTRESCSIILAEAKSLIIYRNLKCLNTDTNGFPCSVSRKVIPSKSVKENKKTA